MKVSPIMGLLSPYTPGQAMFRDDNNSARMSAFKMTMEKQPLFSPQLSALEPHANNPQ